MIGFITRLFPISDGLLGGLLVFPVSVKRSFGELKQTSTIVIIAASPSYRYTTTRIKVDERLAI